MCIIWDVVDQIFLVYFDCELCLVYEVDIVNEIFNGELMVFWGFIFVIGGFNNVYEVCFLYIIFLDELVDQMICFGESVFFQVSGGIVYLWLFVVGLFDMISVNFVVIFIEMILYIVEIFDNCGDFFYDDVFIMVDND